jgi:hypothetical protein
MDASNTLFASVNIEDYEYIYVVGFTDRKSKKPFTILYYLDVEKVKKYFNTSGYINGLTRIEYKRFRKGSLEHSLAITNIE